MSSTVFENTSILICFATRDIDLVVESRAMEYQDKRRILYSLAHVLRKANITSNVQVIAKAKVPIVKFVTNLGWFLIGAIEPISLILLQDASLSISA